jgi:hypothetical protein
MGWVGASVTAGSESDAPENQALLEAAGYVFQREFSLWLHPSLDRALDANVAVVLTVQQIRRWIAGAR